LQLAFVNLNAPDIALISGRAEQAPDKKGEPQSPPFLPL
jgi:hypothetical protein